MLAVLLIVLTGCAAMNKEECASADWYGIGMEHGVSGYTREEYGKLAQACEKHALPADEAQFSAGYAAGLEKHCTPYGGLRLGESGRPYQRVCTLAQELHFLPPYERARAFALAKRAWTDASRELDSAKSKLRQLEREIERERRSVEKIRDPQERNKAMDSLNDKIDEHNDVLADVPGLQNEVLSARMDFKLVEQDYLPYREAFMAEHFPKGSVAPE
jgi:hypothetical protein